MASPPDAEPVMTLRGAVDRMLALRIEHKPILDKIVSDAGMAPETRQTLVEHLWTEEEEKLDAIARMTAGKLTPGKLTPIAPASPRPTNSTGLTVGSLRPAGGGSAGSSVGSLRQS